MNGRVEYITKEISQKEETQENERGPWDARGVEDSSPRARVPSPWDLGLSDPVRFSPLKTSRRFIRAQLPDPLSTNSL